MSLPSLASRLPYVFRSTSRRVRRSGASFHRSATHFATTSEAKQSKDWSVAQYLKYGDERTRAVHELIARIPLTSPKRAIDLGCGPGNSTAVIRTRYPDANITGMDSSANMIKKARDTLPAVEFAVSDLRTYTPDPAKPIDLYFSNAVFHWLPEPERLASISRLLESQPSGSVFAFQVPDNFDEPSHVAMREVAAGGPWATEQTSLNNPLLVRFPGPRKIYDALKPLSSSVDIWHTHYHQILESHQAIIEWVKATGLRPYIDPLSNEHKEEYLKQYLRRLESGYPPLSDGKVMFHFPRLFVVATRA